MCRFGAWIVRWLRAMAEGLTGVIGMGKGMASGFGEGYGKYMNAFGCDRYGRMEDKGDDDDLLERVPP